MASKILVQDQDGALRSAYYHDSSLYKNHGVLTEMDPVTDWVFDGDLGRWVLDSARIKMES